MAEVLIKLGVDSGDAGVELGNVGLERFDGGAPGQPAAVAGVGGGGVGGQADGGLRCGWRMYSPPPPLAGVPSGMLRT